MRAMRNSCCRRGTVLYLTVLSTALLVSLLGLAGLTLIRIERRHLEGNTDRLNARANATSAVELALLAINNDPAWRNTYPSGIETKPLTLGPDGKGTISWIVEDTDLSLKDADTDLRLRGMGRVGESVQVSSVKLKCTKLGLNCLEVAMGSGGKMSFQSSSVISADAAVSSNGSITSSGTVNANVEAVGTITGSGYNGTTTPGAPARVLPGPSVFDYYIANGTVINYSSLPQAGAARLIRDVVLSPSSNPHGATNAEGIYVIDCGGKMIHVEYARIIGTLVLINPHMGSHIQNQLSWEPALSNHPALLIKGSIQFWMTNAVLSETARGVNFNPPGSPYLGSTDSDKTDTYPTKIKGLIYASGDIDVFNNVNIEGCFVLGGILTVGTNATMSLKYDPAILTDPAVGFRVEVVTAGAGSWYWDASPDP